MTKSSSSPSADRPVQAAFVIEQTLGHVTFGQNLSTILADHPRLIPTFVHIPYEMPGWASWIPGYSNWTIRSGVRARRALRAEARTTDIDVMFVHTQVPTFMLRRWMERIPTVVSLDATGEQYDQFGEHYEHRRSTGPVEWWKKRAAKRAYGRARHIVAWSEWARDGLVEQYGVTPDRVTVIAPGVNVEQWKRAGAPPDDTVIKILFVGGDLVRKGAPMLLDVVRRLLRDDSLPPFELHMVTTGELASEPGIVVHRGMKPNSPDLIALYHSSHIFCLPTLGDCLPMVLAEAGEVGLAVVSTDVGAIREIVDDERTGLLIPVGDADGLEVALRRLITDPALRARLGGSAHELVRSHFDAGINANRLADVLIEIAGRQATP